MKSTQQQRNYWRFWREKNKDRIRSRNHLYYLLHKSEYRERCRKWQNANRERYNELQRKSRNRSPESKKLSVLKAREWEKNNPEKFKIINQRHSKKYYLKNKLKIALKNKLRYSTDANYRMKVEINSRLWSRNNREKRREISRRWRIKNKDKLRAKAFLYSYYRRALIKKATKNLSSLKRFVSFVKSRKTVVCYYCQSEIPSRGCHFDHIIPLSKGGQHSVENICVSCPSCNSKKNNKLVSGWTRIGQQILPL